MFDFDILKYHKLNNILNYISKIPKYKNNLGIIFIMKKDIEIFDNIKTKKEKFEYINSKDFINNIRYFIFFDCNIDKKICKIININPQYIDMLLDSFLLNFPNDFFIGIKIDISKIKNYINFNFNYILLCQNYFCLYKNNNINNNKFIDIHNLKYLEENKNKEYCSINIKIQKDTINQLKKFSFIGSTINKDNTISQKEISGKFNIEKINNNINYMLTIDNNSIEFGTEDKVMISPGIYNFHSHPYYTYNHYKVKYAYPSAHDYVGFISSMFIYGTLCHFVLTIEGIYIISLHNSWINKKNKLLTKNIINFIIDNYKVNNNDFTNIENYIKHIMNIKYKNKILFNVKYYDWNIENLFFNLNYSKENNNCLYDDNLILINQIINK